MSTIISNTKQIVDDKGNVIIETVMEKAISKETEPDYIKIYTDMWFDFKRFPRKYRTLFLELAIRMSYCNNTIRSQTVAVIGPVKDEIREACGWKTMSPLETGLGILCECGAIKRIARGCYQINPEFAGRGAWRYNPKTKNGGIKDLRATFNFAEDTVDTVITYDDDTDTITTSHIHDFRGVDHSDDDVSA